MQGVGGHSLRATAGTKLSLVGGTEEALFSAIPGFVDLEWIHFRFVAGVLPCTITLRDKRGDEALIIFGLGLGAVDYFREWDHRLEQRRANSDWTVQISAGTTLDIIAQGREFRTDARGEAFNRL